MGTKKFLIPSDIFYVTASVDHIRKRRLPGHRAPSRVARRRRRRRRGVAPAPGAARHRRRLGLQRGHLVRADLRRLVHSTAGENLARGGGRSLYGRATPAGSPIARPSLSTRTFRPTADCTSTASTPSYRPPLRSTSRSSLWRPSPASSASVGTVTVASSPIAMTTISPASYAVG